jgi:hypothetical protein
VREIRIHSWGGFGSQLNALALALHIRSRYKSRSIKIIVHTSGVTERQLEIEAITPSNIALEVVNDFNPYFENNHIKKSLRNLISRLLEYSKIVIKPNNNSGLKSIRPWTLSTRGHYSNISFDPGVLDSLLKLLTINSSEDKDLGNICHYRLGDLLSLEKGFVDAGRLIQTLISISRNPWCVFSDSTAEAEQMIMKYLPQEMKCVFENSEPLSVINRSVGASRFVGTNSKLSIWIAIFRMHLDKKDTYMPKTLSVGLASVMNDKKLKSISFY